MSGSTPIIGRGTDANVRLTVENATDVKIELDSNRDGRYDLEVSATLRGAGSMVVIQDREFDIAERSGLGLILARRGVDYAPQGLTRGETDALVQLVQNAALAPLPRGRS